MLMNLLPLLSLAALAAAQGEQMILNFEHNATTIVGTWSSGFGYVETGPNFVDVANKRFNPPQVAGISYSFTEDMFFEMAEYRFESNPARPACPTAKLLFQHGQYSLESNGSIILTPFAPDGLVQVQSPCSAKSSTIQQFNATILISQWRIWINPSDQAAHLHLFRFDGAPYNKMVLRYADPKPHMQVTEVILKPTPTPPRARMVKRNAASPSLHLGAAGALLGVVGAVAVGVASVLL